MKKTDFYAVFLLLLMSCQRNKDEVPRKFIGELNLSEEQLQFFPYQLNDTIVFVNAANDSFAYYVSQVDKSKLTGYSDPQNYQSDYFLFEKQEIHFIDLLGNSYYIKISRINRQEQTMVETFFSPPNLGNSPLSYKHFYSYMDTEKFTTSTDVYHPSIIILGKTYNDVFELSDNFSPSPAIDNICKIFYARNRGIVAFRTRNGIDWALNQ